MSYDTSHPFHKDELHPHMFSKPHAIDAICNPSIARDNFDPNKLRQEQHRSFKELNLTKLDALVESQERVFFVIPANEIVSHFVIPAKFSEAGCEPGSRTNRDDSSFLDSGSRSARPE